MTTDQQARSVEGTLFGGDKPRIVAIKDIPIEAELSAQHALRHQQRQAGLHRPLGTALGEAGVNIATFHLGRSEAGGDAIALIRVDQPMDEAAGKGAPFPTWSRPRR